MPLLRKTEIGKIYFAVAHKDNGDNSFDFKSSDPPLKNTAGDLIAAKFEIVADKDSPAGLGGACVVSGCSNEVCAEKQLDSACVFEPEYACYKTAICERQPSGECGWTKTEELKECLNAGF